VRRRAFLLACAASAGARQAHAHALPDRYELPVPLSLVVAAGCAVVVLTFVLAAFFARPRAGGAATRPQRVLHVPTPVLCVLRIASLLLFVVTLAAALWGTQDPLMNLAPTLVWIVAWLGLTFTCAFVADVWPALDPWRGLHAALPRAREPLLPWPHWLGCWPATALLLAWSWLEIVHPIATSPRKLGVFLLAWTAVSLAGMRVFGRPAWQARADVFALAFATFGRLPPLRLDIADPPAAQDTPGLAAFVMALLAGVLFDGFHAAPAWHTFEAAVGRLAPLDVNGYVAGTTGLALAWLALVLLFETATRTTPAGLRERLAIALLPIAAGYVVAHNFATFVLQGQRAFALLSDPFGRQWDLFGTASFYPDLAWPDARTGWLIAVGAIVAGHVASIWWSHSEVRAGGVAPARAAGVLVPLTLLMVGATAVSLTLLAAGDA
jgi:hypothetical protein